MESIAGLFNLNAPDDRTSKFSIAWSPDPPSNRSRSLHLLRCERWSALLAGP
jgi:hypothetical protein